jgi:hypothetical protein
MRIGIGIGIGFPQSAAAGGGADVTAPALSSAIINAAGTSLTLTYSEALDTGSTPALGDFALAGTTLAALTGTPNVTGSTVVLTLAPGVTVGETGITISYTPGGSPIQDAAGNDAAALVTQAVTNNSARAYSPADEGTLVHWGDMNDATSYTESGGVITARTDKVSGSALTPAGSPGYLATGLNSKPTADHNGTTQYFTSLDAGVIATGVNASATTVFAVAALNTVDRLDALVGWGNSGVVDNRTLWFGQTTVLTGRMVAASLNDAGTSIAVSGSTQTDTTAHTYSFITTGTGVSSWIDNVADIVAAGFNPGTVTPNRFGLATRPDSVPDRIADAQISETLVFSVALSAAARTRVHNYLKAKWGTP